jgi:hypothetical protein
MEQYLIGFRCRMLEKLWLYQNSIEKLEGLDYACALVELQLQSNKIKKVEGISRLINLEGLYLTGNPIEDLDDMKEIGTLPRLKKLAFTCEYFQACPVSEIPGYKDFVLSTVGSPYLEMLDSEYLETEDVDDSRKHYMQKAMEL